MKLPWTRPRGHAPRPWESRGAALAELTLDHGWRHRRIDAIRHDDGDQGRWLTSIDCTVPVDSRLLYGDGDVLVVPLARLRKGALRSFDTRDGAGQPLSVLNLDEGVSLSLELLRFLIEQHDEIEFTPTLEAALRVVLKEGKTDAADLFRFLETGEFPLPTDSTSRVDQVLTAREVAQLSEVTQQLIVKLSEEFYLYALVPATSAGVRQVLKFSRHWQHTDKVSAWGLAMTGLGIKGGLIHIPTSPFDAQSYHLQVHLPDGVRAESLVLIGAPEPMTEDYASGQTAHVRCSWPADDTSGTPFGASLAIGMNDRGLARQAMLLSVASALFFIASFWFDGALETMRSSRDSASLLLAVPAALAVFTLGGSESEMKTQMLAAPRVMIGVCAAVLTLAATSLTWQLRDPWFIPTWIAGLVVTGLCAALAVTGEVARRTRWRQLRTLSSLQRGQEV